MWITSAALAGNGQFDDVLVIPDESSRGLDGLDLIRDGRSGGSQAFERVNSGGRALVRFPASRSCTLDHTCCASRCGELKMRGDLRIGMAASARDRTESILKTTVIRWAFVARAIVASTWLFIAPWLAALVART